MISVIVCTYKRPQILARLLKSFSEQIHLDQIDYELIIVDNGSVGDSWSVAKRFMHLLKMCYVSDEKAGLSLARNRGITESKGDITAFLDDDVIVDGNAEWQSRCQINHAPRAVYALDGDIHIPLSTKRGRVCLNALSRLRGTGRRNGARLSIPPLGIIRGFGEQIPNALRGRVNNRDGTRAKCHRTIIRRFNC